MLRHLRYLGIGRCLVRKYSTNGAVLVNLQEISKCLGDLGQLVNEELERSDVHKMLQSLSCVPSKQLFQHMNSLEIPEGGVLRVNLELKKRFTSRDPKIINFIMQNISSQLDHNLLESILNVNLDESNFEEMVKLLEVFIDKQNFYPSNNLWSRYLSLTGQLFSVEGAKLMVHNVIDRFTFYNNEYSAYNCIQTQIPFIVTPKSIETLGFIFQKNGLPEHIIILRDYLKRFFSLYTERDVFKSLCISLVEAYSQTGDIKNALWSYRYLCMHFKDHYNTKSRQLFLEELHSSFHDSSTWRQKNIKSNQYRYPDWPDELKSNFDKLQDLEMQETFSTIYRPIDAKSVQTRIVPIIEGKLQLTDVPLFTHLINNLVVRHMKSQETQKIAYLLKIVKSNHFKLLSIIAQCLTSNNYLEETLIFLSKMRYVKPDLRMPVLFSDDLFFQMFKECSKKINLITSSNLLSMDKLLELDNHINKLIKIYFNVNKNTPYHANPKIMASYLSLLLKSPRFQNSLVQTNLMTFMTMYKGKIYLEADDFNKFSQSYDLESSVFKDCIATRL